MKTWDLEGRKLDAAVALAVGYSLGELKGHPGSVGTGKNGRLVGGLIYCRDAITLLHQGTFWPSREWVVGGPLIEEHKINLWFGWNFEVPEWSAEINASSPKNALVRYGPTPLVAAMRALVAAKLGEDIDLPDIIKDMP